MNIVFYMDIYQIQIFEEVERCVEFFCSVNFTSVPLKTKQKSCIIQNIKYNLQIFIAVQKETCYNKNH